jgi:cytochrome P450
MLDSNDADHTRMRRLLAHAFSDAALREQEPILTQYFDLMVTELSRCCEAGGSVDMTKWYNCLTFDVIGDLCFGESFHALDSGEYHFWMRNVFQGIKVARVLQIIGAYGASGLLMAMTNLIPSLSKAKDEHERFSQLKTSQRMEMKTDRKDFITYVTSIRSLVDMVNADRRAQILRYNDERGMSKAEIENTVNALIVAGSETTATLLSGATYYMLMNPQVYEKAKAEVRSAFAHPEDMTLASTARLPYLHALMEEGLRMYPPVAFALPRVTGKDGDHIAGHWVPPNVRPVAHEWRNRILTSVQTTVGVPQWTINKSITHWASPEVFAPERWLEDRPKEYKDDKRAAMNAFSLGPRGCIGKK